MEAWGGIGAETGTRTEPFFCLFPEGDKTKADRYLAQMGARFRVLNPRGLYNRPLQLRIANTTIMIIEFH
jgi:hypothetical protein